MNWGSPRSCWNAGPTEGLAVDDWARGDPGNLAEIARAGITYAFGRCEEMHAQLGWMRDWNTTGEHQVGSYGIDVPGWCTNPGPVPNCHSAPNGARWTLSDCHSAPNGSQRRFRLGRA